MTKVINVFILGIIMQITFLNLMCFNVFASEIKIASIDFGKNMILQYQLFPVTNKKTGEILYNKGKITIRKENDVIYEKTVNYEPGSCENYKELSKNKLELAPEKMLSGKGDEERSVVIICGSVSGRHNILELFLNAPGEIRETSIDFENSIPNLSDRDGDGIYEAIVYRKILFDDIGYQTVPYLFIYELQVDNSIFGFSPAYGVKKSEIYAEYYTKLRAYLDKGSYASAIGPYLAALVATQDQSKICGELKSAKIAKLTLDEIKQWQKRLVSAGYPDFDFNKCGGK